MSTREEAVDTSSRGFKIRCSMLHWDHEEMEKSHNDTPGFSHTATYQQYEGPSAGPADEMSCQAVGCRAGATAYTEAWEELPE